jgi:hypothetical protein
LEKFGRQSRRLKERFANFANRLQKPFSQGKTTFNHGGVENGSRLYKNKTQMPWKNSGRGTVHPRALFSSGEIYHNAVGIAIRGFRSTPSSDRTPPCKISLVQKEQEPRL